MLSTTPCRDSLRVGLAAAERRDGIARHLSRGVRRPAAAAATSALATAAYAAPHVTIKKGAKKMVAVESSRNAEHLRASALNYDRDTALSLARDYLWTRSLHVMAVGEPLGRDRTMKGRTDARLR